MAKYTTGEIAKLCGVSVRTVQYYDSRGILTPSELSAGGRQLYSESDLQRLKVICFLRGIDLPINAISQILADERPEDAISLLLEQQSSTLHKEIDERAAQLNRLEALQKGMKDIQPFTLESINDVAYLLERRKPLSRMRFHMLAVGFVMDAIQVITLVIGIVKGVWWPFVAGLIPVIALGAWISGYYFRRTAYICPQCHQVFRPAFQEALFARHTPNTRKLHCPACDCHGFCVETAANLPE